MEQPDDPGIEERHWRQISLWLAALSLIPTAVTIMVAISGPDIAGAWVTTRRALAAAAIAGCALAIAAGGASVRATRTRTCAQWSCRGFVIGASAMVLAWLTLAIQSIVEATGLE